MITDNQSPTTKVTGLLYPQGIREDCEFSSLEDLYFDIMNTPVIDQSERFPYYVVFEDGVVAPFVLDYFRLAFDKGKIYEHQLRAMLVESGI